MIVLCQEQKMNGSTIQSVSQLLVHEGKQTIPLKTIDGDTRGLISVKATIQSLEDRQTKQQAHNVAAEKKQEKANSLLQHTEALSVFVGCCNNLFNVIDDKVCRIICLLLGMII